MKKMILAILMVSILLAGGRGKTVLMLNQFENQIPELSSTLQANFNRSRWKLQAWPPQYLDTHEEELFEIISL